MRLWSSLALLGLLLLPACASKPADNPTPNEVPSQSQPAESAQAPGQSQPAESAQAPSQSQPAESAQETSQSQPAESAQETGSTQASNQNSPDSVKGITMPPNNLPNPKLPPEWVNFNKNIKAKYDTLCAAFPEQAFQVLKEKYDHEKVMCAFADLEYCGNTLDPAQKFTVEDSYYSALNAMKSIKAAGISPKGLPEMFGMLQSIEKTAKPLIEHPTDIRSDLASSADYVQRQVAILANYYIESSTVPSGEVLLFNSTAYSLVSKIKDKGPYQDIYALIVKTKDSAENVTKLNSQGTSGLRCLVSDLDRLLKRLQKEGKFSAEVAKKTEKDSKTKPEAVAASGKAVRVASKPVTAHAKGQGSSQYPLNKEITTKSGLKITITQAGKGENCKKGKLVTVHYSGYFIDGQVFDSSYTRMLPLEFPLGMGYVIDGWEEGVVGMQVGEKRHLIIPPALGYGEKGSGPIPGNATLIFDVEMLKIE